MSNIIIPDRAILLPRKGRPAMRFEGEYRFIALDGETLEKNWETDWSKNLVTNYGLDQIGAGVAMASYCRIGTGNTAPSYADVALVSQSAATATTVASTSTNVGAPNYETQITVTFQFALGAVVGNMAEVGVGTTASGSTLCSRALIVDGGGSPTTITVLSSEILQVVYRFTAYPALTDATGTVTIGGVAYNYVSRCYSAATALAVNPNNQSFFGSVFSPRAFESTSTLGSFLSSGPSGTAAGFGGYTNDSYVPGTYYRDATLTAGIADANVPGGIAAIAFIIGSGGGVFFNQMSFTKAAGGGPIPKDNTKALSIKVRQPFSHH